MRTKFYFAKYSEKRFLVALVAQIGALVILFAPEYTDQVNQIAAQVSAAVVAVSSLVAFIISEGKVDVENSVFNSDSEPR